MSSAPQHLRVGQRGTKRLSRRDLAWRDNTPVHAMVLDSLPSPEQIRAAFAEVATAVQGSYALRLVDIEAGRWRALNPAELQEYLEAIVVQAPRVETEADLAQRTERAQLTPLGDLPFRAEIAPQSAVFTFRHALGDGRTIWSLAVAIAFPDRMNEILAADSRDPRRPLITALWHTFGRNPRRLLETLRSEREAFPLRASGHIPLRAEAFEVVGRRSALGFRREIQRHRKATAPGSSMVGFLVARAMGAIYDHGLNPYQGVGVVADARRHLPGRRLDVGNFSSAAYLPIADPRDAVLATRAIDAFAESARPLLTLAAMAAHARRGQLTEAVWLESDEAPRPLVTFTNMGRLPWPGEPPVAWHALGRPIGRYGLAILMYEVGGYVYASVSYDGRHVQRSLAEDVADALTSLS
jgi:hypothetical protein